MKNPRGPFDFIVGNCMSVSTSPARAIAIFVAYMGQEADVWLLSECADFDARKVLLELGIADTHTAIQYGALNSPESSVVLVYRRDRIREVRRALAKGTPGSRRVRARPLVKVRFAALGRIRVTACHAPLNSTGFRAAYLALVRAAWGIRGGDLNALRAKLVKLMAPSRVYSVEVLHLIVPRRLKAKLLGSIPESRLANADHPGVRVRVWQ